MKRSNGEGTIFKRSDGRWCAAFYDESPCPKRHFVYGNTQAEVKKKLKEKKEQLKNGEQKKKNIYTLEGWILYYLENYKKNEVKITTFCTYMDQFNKHIREQSIGKVELEKLTSDMLQQFYNSKQSEGYNPKTIKHIYVLINSSLKKAVQLKIIHENMNAATVLPKIKEFRAKTLSVEEVNRIKENAKEEELYPIVILTIYTGMRKGEVMALKWENINFEGKELYVDGSLCNVPKEMGRDGKIVNEYKVLSPKTEKSRRIIPLLDIVIEALILQKQRQEKVKSAFSQIYIDEGFVFARRDGSCLEQGNFMKKYHAFLDKFGLPSIRFHDLRHTFASLLLEAGESPKVIQELLGHSTITTTMDIYAHVTKKGKVKAIERLDKMTD